MALVKATSEAIGLTQLAKGWGMSLHASVHVDSSAALAVAHRKGNGKLRHVRIGNLWIQQLAEADDVSFLKVAGGGNPADAMTKHLAGPRIQELVQHLSQCCREGQAASKLGLNSIQGRSHEPQGPRRRNAPMESIWHQPIAHRSQLHRQVQLAGLNRLSVQSESIPIAGDAIASAWPPEVPAAQLSSQNFVGSANVCSTRADFAPFPEAASLVHHRWHYRRVEGCDCPGTVPGSQGGVLRVAPFLTHVPQGQASCGGGSDTRRCACSEPTCCIQLQSCSKTSVSQ